MTKKTEPSLNQKSPGTGKSFVIPTRGLMAILHGAPFCFAVLAYMDQPEKWQRYILAVRSWQAKNLIKPSGIRLPGNFRAAFPKMRARQLQGILNMGVKRIGHRVRMGRHGWSLFAGDGIQMRYTQPTPKGKIGIQLRGTGSLSDGVRDVLRQKKEEHINVESQSATANEMHLFAESMPVLHIAMALCTKLAPFDPESSDDEKLFYLLHTSEWLFDTLNFADQLRQVLHSRIPRFDPDKALRLIPAEDQPAI